MSGLITGASTSSLEIAAAIIAALMVLGVVDIVTKPNWAWKRAQQSKPAYLVLVVLLPLVGLVMYVLRARANVAAIASSGRAASLPFERFGTQPPPTAGGSTPASTPSPFGSFGGRFDGTPVPALTVPDPDTVATRRRSSIFTAGGTRGHSSVGLATRTARPRHRAGQHAVEAATPVPAGWKADPTGRHQFRYWDGGEWTENVANSGVHSLDEVDQ